MYLVDHDMYKNILEGTSRKSATKRKVNNGNKLSHQPSINITNSNSQNVGYNTFNKNNETEENSNNPTNPPVIPSQQDPIIQAEQTSQRIQPINQINHHRLTSQDL